MLQTIRDVLTPHRKGKMDAQLARLAELNHLVATEGRTPERTAELDKLGYELRRNYPEHIQGTTWLPDGRLVLLQMGDPTEDIHRPRFSDPRAERIHDLRLELRELANGTLSEFARVARGLELTQEIERLQSELAHDRREKALADFQALCGPAREAAQQVKTLQAQLAVALDKLLPLEAELVAAMQESARLADEAQSLAATHPVLAGRRVCSPVSPSTAIPTSPGTQILHMAQMIGRPTAPRLVAV